MASASVVEKFNKLPDLIRNSPKLAQGAIQALAFDGERYVKQIIKDSPATGRTYITTDPDSGSTVTHTASSPGNPPRKDTGTLINSIHTRPAGLYQYRITAGTDYAYTLEFGSSKMAARPFMVPMLYYIRQEAPSFFENLVEG